MVRRVRIDLPKEKTAAFCRRYHIQKLSFFGSVLRDSFEPDSDVDVLVEFEAGKSPGLIRFAGIEMEFSHILGGRKIDMNTPKCLSRYFRDKVLEEADCQHEESPDSRL